ncbi:hypothetical protein CHU98_g8745 [Xylaria longipes]|nr:hypothetical protein CHU98_g8745 [Xylaria longipes]
MGYEVGDNFGHADNDVGLDVMVVDTSSYILAFVLIEVELVPFYDLALWRTAVVLTETAANIVGGPMGSQLTENFGWRTTFGFESLLILCATLAATFTLRKPNYSKTSLRSTWRNLDVPGTILLVTTDAILLIAVNLGGNELPWSHPVVITLLILVIPAVGLLCAVELYSANDAVIPLHCFNDHRIGSVIACGAIADFAYTQVISNLALYVETKLFETGSGFSDSALSLVFLGRPLGSACAGLVIKYARAYKILILAAVCANGLIYGGIGLRFIHFGSFYALFKLTSEIFGDIGIDVSLALTQSLTRFRLAFEIGSTPHRDESLDSIRQLPPHTRRIILNAFSSATETTFVLSALVIFLGVLAAWKIPELEAGGTVGCKRRQEQPDDDVAHAVAEDSRNLEYDVVRLGAPDRGAGCVDVEQGGIDKDDMAALLCEF